MPYKASARSLARPLYDNRQQLDLVQQDNLDSAHMKKWVVILQFPRHKHCIGLMRLKSKFIRWTPRPYMFEGGIGSSFNLEGRLALKHQHQIVGECLCVIASGLQIRKQ
ncbi:unnamed protein product [Euphydryas editha]|uniref:Uncharacterized protein n=1 Tax=Euphydryas editha TaxID=104508 RepID=A0AAU9V4K4_EUPED|nr:unnamed protein product [Euphydryas editha]